MTTSAARATAARIPHIPLLLLVSALVAESAYADSAGVLDHHLRTAAPSRAIDYADRDGDGFPNADDALPYHPDEWIDSDNDGIGNNQDPDDDNDGMPDIHELGHNLDSLTHDVGLDNDGDGASNIAEYLSGSDPHDLLSCTGSACSFDRVPTPAQIIFPAPDPASDAVGATAGSFSVTHAGAAEYTIPLYVPAGTAGMAPTLALQYRSNAGNGLLGYGWGLGGLSSISRCPQTRVQDGQARAVGFNADDRFCLDGERLVTADPGDTYGGNGVEYRTETESFRKVVSFGTAGSGPAYFVVWNKDGSVSEYGNSADSRAVDPLSSSVMLWARNRLERRDSYNGAGNNPVIYTYWNDGSIEKRLKAIQYAYANSASIHNAMIEFEYENRPDRSSIVLPGWISGRTTRLSRIIVKNRLDGVLTELRTYKLFYSNNSGHNQTSKLDRIQECRSNVCLPATQFRWSDRSSDYRLSVSASVEGFSTYPFRGAGGLPRFAAADFNGDGMGDLVWLEKDGDHYRFKASPSNGATLLAATTQSAAAHAIDSWTLDDYDQDGYPDILFTSNAALHVYLNKAVNGQRSYDAAAIQLIANLDMGTEPGLDGSWFGPKGVFADLNADGLLDLLYNKVVFHMEADPQEIHGPYRFGSASVITLGDPATTGTLNNEVKTGLDAGAAFATIDFDKAIVAGDFNRDGLPDLIVDAWFDAETDYIGAKVLLLNDGTGNFSYFDSFSPSSTWEANDRAVLLADVNGDGTTEVFWHRVSANPTYKWRFHINDGTGLQNSERDLYTNAGQYALDMNLRDINQDGHPDFVYRIQISGPDEIRVLLNDGTGNFAAVTDSLLLATVTGSELGNHLFMDINGDGIADFVDLRSTAWLGEKADAAAYNKITRIADGLGHRTSIAYAPLTDPAVYTREFDAPSLETEYPSFDVFSPMSVVSSVNSSAPIDGDANHERTVSYHYGGFKVQPAGRGSLGFRSMKITDEESGTVATSTFRQDFPFIGMPATNMTHVAGQATALTETSHSYALLPHINGTTAPPWLPVFTGSTSIQRIAESAPTADSPVVIIAGILTTTTVTAGNHDAYGNAGTRTVSVTGDGSTHSTTTTNTYSNNPAAWLIGQLTRSVVTQHEGSSGSTRTTDYSYDPANGLLLSETREPQGNNAIKMTTTYEYDAFGNRSRITESSAYGTRYSRSVYDATGRYIDLFYNGLEELVSSVTQRDAYGSPETIADANGTVQHLRYGILGRQFFSATNAGSATTTHYRFCGDTSCNAPGAVYRAQSTGNDGSLNSIYVDKLGRTIRTETKSFNGALALVDTRYDGSGRPERVSTPYFSGDPVYWNTSLYDQLGRVIKVIAADGSVSTTHFSRREDGADVGLRQITTNALGQHKTTITNGRGQILLVQDHLGGSIQNGYDAAGNLVEVNANGVLSELGYDILGRRLSLDDPDQGQWSYLYNAFGELTRQTASNGAETLMSYDSLGRMTKRQDLRAGQTLESHVVWTYGTDAGANELGQLVLEQDLVGGYIKAWFYDGFGRPRKTITSLGQNGSDGEYAEYRTYDKYGRPFQQIDATVRGIQYKYNAHGHLEKLVEASDPGHVYHAITQTNARGQTTAESLLDGRFQMVRGYDSRTSLPTTIVASSAQYAVTAGGSTLLDLALEFDAAGNLVSRTRQVAATTALPARTLSEAFGYDALNRLTSIVATGHATQTLDYDLAGNILSKSGVGSYTYGAGAAGPHAVTGIGNDTYSYDAIGNMLGGGGRNAVYNAFRKPVTVSKGSHVTSFDYGPDRQHYKRVDNNGSTVTTTLTVGNVELVREGSSPLQTKRYIGGMIVVTDTPTIHEEHALLTDHLGSTAAIASATALELTQLDYDAFGKRRSLWTLNELAQADLGPLNQLTTTGFTGHEMLDEAGLIHMNGRVYDPVLGRFLSADPYITEPGNTQNYNRYSYVYNNPLTLADPSGFCADRGLDCDGGSMGPLCHYACGMLGSIFDDFYYDNHAGNCCENIFLDEGGNWAPTSSLIDSGRVVMTHTDGNTTLTYASSAVMDAPEQSYRNISNLMFAQAEQALAESAQSNGHSSGEGRPGDIFQTHSDRIAGKIYITGHRIKDIGPMHTAIEYTNADADPVTLWISAGPSDTWTIEGVQYLIGGIGSLDNKIRPTDAPNLNITLGEVIPPSGMTHAEYFNSLMGMANSYKNNVDYDYFPENFYGYNSNSYVAGLLQATGGSSSVDFSQWYGGSTPLPVYYFGQ